MPRKTLEDGTGPSAGYGQPPEQHRTRDGEIRNPWGRRGKPKQEVDFLDGTIRITVDGRQQRVTRQEALDHFLFARAAKGNTRAAELLEQRRRQRQAFPADTKGVELSPDDRAAFDRFVLRAAGHLNGKEAS